MHKRNRGLNRPRWERGTTRRSLLLQGAQISALASVALLLAGCDQSTPPTEAASKVETRGGFTSQVLAPAATRVGFWAGEDFDTSGSRNISGYTPQLLQILGNDKTPIYFIFFGGTDPGSGLITSYYRSAQHYFGKAGQITLGIAGHSGYVTMSEMIHDVRLLATLGATNVPIYSLEDSVKAYGVNGISKIISAAKQPFTGSEAQSETAPETTVTANAMRTALVGLDAVAVAATPVGSTTSHGTPQLPNAWPNGCN